MKDERRDELLAVIAELSKIYPDWRLGQLVANLADWADQNVWDADDEQLLAVARRHLQQSTATAVATRNDD